MKTYTHKELKEVLAKHALYLKSDPAGERANLSGADLGGADLRSADLSRANLKTAKMSNFALVPETGSFIGWKKVRGGAILKLEILKSAKRVSTPIGRKCRASAVKVLAAYGTKRQVKALVSAHDLGFTYKVGKIARVKNFDASIQIECTRGIHFFITRKEAEEYDL